MRPEGFEPPAYGLEVRCSIQLSYGRKLMIKAIASLFLLLPFSFVTIVQLYELNFSTALLCISVLGSKYLIVVLILL